MYQYHRDLNELSRQVADASTAVIADAVERHGRCSIVLAGGETPRTLYRLWASSYRDRIPWTDVHVFWGDERYVPPDDPNSNYWMARETLLDHVACPPGNIHPMRTHVASPDAAAEAYEMTLREYFGDEAPRFDLVLLGLGADGHTASLFPGSAAVAEQARWVVATTAPIEPRQRLSLTLPIVNQASNIYVLVGGTNKADALQHVLSGTADPSVYPAAGLHPSRGTLNWYVARVP